MWTFSGFSAPLWQLVITVAVRDEIRSGNLNFELLLSRFSFWSPVNSSSRLSCVWARRMKVALSSWNMSPTLRYADPPPPPTPTLNPRAACYLGTCLRVTCLSHIMQNKLHNNRKNRRLAHFMIQWMFNQVSTWVCSLTDFHTAWLSLSLRLYVHANKSCSVMCNVPWFSAVFVLCF